MNKAYVHILLDRSGSMESIRDKTVSSYNEYVRSLRQDKETDTRLSLTIFDSDSTDLIRDRVPITGNAEINPNEYQPRSMTPLYDAIGSVASAMRKTELRHGERVTLVIVTDGYENFSKEYNAATVKSLIDGFRQSDWLVVFLGANQDAILEGSKFGTYASTTASYAPSNIRQAFAATARMTTAYNMGTAVCDSCYTSSERAAMINTNDDEDKISNSILNAP